MTYKTILRSLDGQSLEMEHKVFMASDDPNELFVLGLELNKMISNMDYARGLILEMESSGRPVEGDSRPLLKRINQRLQLAQHRVQSQQEQEVRAYEKEKQKLSKPAMVVEFESGLRNRRSSATDIGHSNQYPSSTSTDMSLDDKLSVQHRVQEDLSHDILDMVSKIKANAIALGDKLATDTDVVTSTSEALHKTSGSMAKVGTRLNKYHSSGALGWKFYIMAIIFLIVAIFSGMTIIRLFPKW